MKGLGLVGALVLGVTVGRAAVAQQAFGLLSPATVAAIAAQKDSAAARR